MGIEIPEQPDPPDPNCLNIFNGDEAPGILIAIVTGIEKGPLWIPANGEPLNGEYELIQQPGFPCGWAFLDLPVVAAFSSNVGFTQAELKDNGPPVIFHLFGQMFSEPFFNVDGNVPAPGAHFTGGKFRVMW